MSALLTIFWGIVVLSIVVFIHEGGHYLASRMFGVRVLEFFLGLPSRMSKSHISKRNGTRFGVTALPFGGYARIAGMDMGLPQNPNLKFMLMLLMSRGSLTVDEATRALGGDKESAQEILLTLSTWGSAIPVDEDGEILEATTLKAYEYLNPARDANGNTLLDGANLEENKSNNLGESSSQAYLNKGSDKILELERNKIYAGQSVPKRIVILLAGIIVNILFAFIVLTLLFLINGAYLPTTTLELVVENSPAEEAGILPDDELVSIGDTQIETWQDALISIDEHRGDEVSIVVERNGKSVTLEGTIPKDTDEPFGVQTQVQHKKFTPTEAFQASLKYVQLTALAVASLLNPSTAAETLDNSVSIVGIAAEANKAASSGFTPLVALLALISLSLGLMNLLPIPPLDGGKVVLEAIEGITKRPVPARIQYILSLVGIALFMGLFFYLLIKDTFTYIIGN